MLFMAFLGLLTPLKELPTICFFPRKTSIVRITCGFN